MEAEISIDKMMGEIRQEIIGRTQDDMKLTEKEIDDYSTNSNSEDKHINRVDEIMELIRQEVLNREQENMEESTIYLSETKPKKHSNNTDDLLNSKSGINDKRYKPKIEEISSSIKSRIKEDSILFYLYKIFTKIIKLFIKPIKKI